MESVETVDEQLSEPVDQDLVDEIANQLAEHGEAHIDTDGCTLSVIETFVDEPPVHRAVCLVDGCAAAVTYRPTLFGGGFTVLERVGTDGEASIGMGPNGRPVCPVDGHGEMTLADETLPAAEAFAEVQRMQEAQQRALPGVFPVFNYAGAFNEIVEQAQRVERLKSHYDDAKKDAAEAKKSLDAGAELLMRMTLRFEQRRKEKPEEPDAPSLAAPSAIRCVWDQQHPDEACPLCNDANLGPADRAVVEGVLGEKIAEVHTNAHAAQVTEYRTKLDVLATADALIDVLLDVPVATIAAWTPEQRAAVRQWAIDVTAAPDVTSEPPFPAELGRPHRAAVVAEGDIAQRCLACTQTIKTFDDKADAYPTLALVGLDCPGEEVEQTHHYPERKKKSAAVKKSAAMSTPREQPAKARTRKKKGSR